MSDTSPPEFNMPKTIDPAVSEMTDRELLEEIVVNMRSVRDVVDSLTEHPMVAALSNGQNPMLAALGFRG